MTTIESMIKNIWERHNYIIFFLGLTFSVFMYEVPWKCFENIKHEMGSSFLCEMSGETWEILDSLTVPSFSLLTKIIPQATVLGTLCQMCIKII